MLFWDDEGQDARYAAPEMRGSPTARESQRHDLRANIVARTFGPQGRSYRNDCKSSRSPMGSIVPPTLVYLRESTNFMDDLRHKTLGSRI